MFPILLGKIKELEDKIKNIVIPEPYDPASNVIILHKSGSDALNMKWKEISKLVTDGKQFYVNPSEWSINFPDNDDSLFVIISVYQYASNSYVVEFGSLRFATDNVNGYPAIM